MDSIHLTVSGMTCGNCVKHVEKAIASIAGVKSVEVDLASGAVKVDGDIAQKVPEIIAALEEDGYPAKVSTDKVEEAKSGPCKSGSGCCCG
jgi:copper chaperone CopZ